MASAFNNINKNPSAYLLADGFLFIFIIIFLAKASPNKSIIIGNINFSENGVLIFGPIIQ